jgi:broad specificity phosphatase PhoE
MTVYLVRHARAGSRQRWKKDDALRPLSKVGRVQASGLARSMARRKVERVVTSPYLRCLETVDAIAAKRDLTITTANALAEGAPLSEALRVFEKVIDQEAVLCTHGDIVRDLLDHFGRHGLKLRDHRMEKGSIWVLEVTDGEVTDARYRPPPKPH